MVRDRGLAVRSFAFAAEKVAMVSLCSMLPMLTVADSDIPDVLDCSISSYCSPDRYATPKLSLRGGVNALFLDWRPVGNSFFVAGGMFANQNHFGYGTDPDVVDPTSNISLKPFKPYIGTYLGLGWKGQSSKNFMWMVDLGLAEQQPLNVVQNIQASSTTHTENERTSTTTKWRVSSKRAGFSFRMKWH